MSEQAIVLTERAISQFLDALVAESMEDHAIRVLAERKANGRIIYGLDFGPPGEQETDENEHLQGALKLWFQRDVGELIGGTTIDYVVDDNGRKGFKFNNPKAKLGWENALYGDVQEFLDKSVNPGLSSHGGSVELWGAETGTVKLKMMGGCQGCGMAAITLRDGIEVQLLEAFPQIDTIVDITDHDAGENPYYDKEK